MSTIMPVDSTYAAAPFDHAKADIILRSSDKVDFRIFKLFLSLASPFFETLFDIPQPAQASAEQIKDGLVVIPVTEDSKTLDVLLRFCYPCTLADDPHLETFEHIIPVLEAAKKYALDAIERKVCHTLSNPKILEVEPFRCFAIAHRGQLREEALLAARYTLTQPLLPSWFQEINMITATDLLVLLTYHQECGDAVYALGSDISWIKSYYQNSQGCAWLSRGSPGNGFSFASDGGGPGDCKCPKSPTPRYRLFKSQSLQWWEDFMEETFLALRDKPCAGTVESFVEKTVKRVTRLDCSTCSALVPEGMRGFSCLLVKRVDEVVSRIRLDFNLQRRVKTGLPGVL